MEELSEKVKLELAILLHEDDDTPSPKEVGPVLDALFRRGVLSKDEYETLVAQDWEKLRLACKKFLNSESNSDSELLIMTAHAHVDDKIRKMIPTPPVSCITVKDLQAYITTLEKDPTLSITERYVVERFIKKIRGVGPDYDSYWNDTLKRFLVVNFWMTETINVSYVEMDALIRTAVLAATHNGNVSGEDVMLILWAWGHAFDHTYADSIVDVYSKSIEGDKLYQHNVDTLPFGKSWLNSARFTAGLELSKSIDAYDNAMKSYLTMSEHKASSSVQRMLFFARYQTEHLILHTRDVLHEPALRGVRDRKTLEEWVWTNLYIAGSYRKEEDKEEGSASKKSRVE